MVSGTWQAIHPTFQFRYRFLYIVNTLRRLTHLEYLRQDKPNASKCCGDSTYYCSYYLYEIHYIITFERATNILNNLCIPALSRLFLIKSSVGGRDHYQNPQGITAGFKKAIKQGCQVVVIDLDKHPNKFKFLPTFKMASAINNRYRDFQNDTILECYVVYNNKAIRISKEFYSDDKRATKELIRMELEKISGDRSHP